MISDPNDTVMDNIKALKLLLWIISKPKTTVMDNIEA